jgi:hypothetical protein
MYAAVPRMIPFAVAAMLKVGDSRTFASAGFGLHAFGEAEVEDLHGPIGLDLDVGGFRSR